MEIYSIILINKYAHNKYCRIITNHPSKQLKKILGLARIFCMLLNTKLCYLIFFKLVKFTQKIHVLRRIFFHVLSNT